MTQCSPNRRLWVFFISVVVVLNASCSARPQFPEELKLDRVIYKTGEQHLVGPGGLNMSFVVFELPKEVSATMSNKGLLYLNSLPSVLEQKRNSKPPRAVVSTWKNSEGETLTGTSTPPYWAPFVIWRSTPVPAEQEWLRYGRDLEVGWKPSLKNFYNAYKEDISKDSLIETIPPEFSADFHEAISTPGNFYAYGFYRDKCLLLVSPKLGKAFYLFRD